MFHGNRPQNPGEPVGRVLQERASSTVHQAPALRDDLRPERGQPTSDAGQEHPQHSLRLGPPLAELHRHARRRQRIPGGFRPGMLFSLSSGSRHPAEAGTPVHCLWPRRIQDGERPSAVPLRLCVTGLVCVLNFVRLHRPSDVDMVKTIPCFCSVETMPR